MTASTVVATPSASDKSRLRRVVAAATIGTALEFFDLIVYGFFAVTIAKLFFPTSNELVSLLLTLGTFGVSYLMRPLGALVLGSYSDRHGRKKGLSLTIGIMALGTLLIAVAPTYQSAGLLGPVIIIVARLLQGFSAGGEFGAATSFLVEHSPRHQKGFYASFQMAAQGGTALLGALFGTALTNLLTEQQMLSWGWRLPFLFGMCIVPVAHFIRKHAEETPVFKQAKHATSPVQQTFVSNKMRLFLAIGTYILGTSSSYVIVLYTPTFIVKQLGVAPSQAFLGTLIIGATQLFLCPFFGHVSDRFGRFKTLAVAALVLGVGAIPLYTWLISVPSVAGLLLLNFILGVFVSAFQGPLPAVLSELFPSQVRTTGLALTHNLTVAIFGGFAPLILTWALNATHNKLVPAFYITAAAALSLISLYFAARKFAASIERD